MIPKLKFLVKMKMKTVLMRARLNWSLSGAFMKKLQLSRLGLHLTNPQVSFSRNI